MRKVIVNSMALVLLVGGIAYVVWLDRSTQHRDGPSPLAPFRKLNAAIRMYEMDCGRPPDSLQSLVQPDGAKGWTGPYMEGPVPSDAWGHPIQYRVSSSNSFEFQSAGPDGIVGTADDLIWTPNHTSEDIVARRAESSR